VATNRLLSPKRNHSFWPPHTRRGSHLVLLPSPLSYGCPIPGGQSVSFTLHINSEAVDRNSTARTQAARTHVRHGAPDYVSSRLVTRRMILQLYLVDWTATPAPILGTAAVCTDDDQGTVRYFCKCILHMYCTSGTGNPYCNHAIWACARPEGGRTPEVQGRGGCC
jgi:hypothetical protein